ncbi:hypothetical protein EDB82DRAFT_553856 [Fusarium venenatum]|uniref:uncharacterized protein n=1 Tax=Fusarium venenatum TaxID=56646 RepID=UPI001D8577C2|nr:hypothetical protein EDB82DRAFT_553856 [Fusarium venenatum]
MWFQLIALATLLPNSNAFSVTTSNDANTLAAAIFGQGITILQASFSGASVSSGTFADGPFGIGSGAILTSGAAIGALPNGDHYVNNGAPGSDTYCGSNTFNAALLTVDIFLDPTYNGIKVEIILASEEEGGSADPIGVFLGGTQYALDSGNRITAVNPYLANPLAITPPNSVTSYPGSSPPLWFDILTSGAQTMVFAICDQSDSEWDSGLLIKAEGCVDCDTDLRLAYVTTTTTIPAGEDPFTSTTTASGTVSGTIRIGVLATTSEEPTTTTAEETTTTADFGTTTTTADEITTTTADETTSTTEASSTDSTSDDPTTTITQETTTIGTTEISTEASSTIISSTQLPDTTSTTLTSSDTKTESSTIVTESDVVTTTAQDYSTDSTTDTETTNISDAPVIVPNPGTTTTAESLETTTAQQIEPSTNTATPSSLISEEETSSSDADDVPTPATSTVATSSAMPSNLAVIGNFRFFGCLGSPEGYPGFELIGETPDMTTTECVRLGAGRAYIGIYLRSCYAADSLDAADTVADGRCDLPCPGDPGLFCGGVVDTSSDPESRFKSRGRLSRRDAPPGILLTLYAQIEAISGTLSSSDTFSTVGAITSNSLLPTRDSTVPLPLFSSTQSFINSAITVEPSVPITRSQGGRPIIPPFPTSAPFNAGNFTSTRVAAAPIVTTITYTVVNPNNPSQLTVTEFCSTLRPSPCRQCQHQPRPTVEMTTIKVDCNACGHSGENTIILEVPAGAAVAAQTRQHAAYQTHRVQYHEPSPYEQRPYPIEGDSHNWQKPRPQNDLPATGDRSHEGDGRYKFDQPQTYHHRPSGAGDYDEDKPAGVINTEPRPDGKPTSVTKTEPRPDGEAAGGTETEPRPDDEPAGVTKTEPRPDTVGGDGQPKPQEPTFHRRPGPAFTPAAPNAPIVVVSRAVAKTMEGILMMMSLLTGLVFLL